MTGPILKHSVMLLFLMPFCVQCRTTQTKRTGVEEEYKSLYIHQFKLTYLRKVFLAGFNRSKAIKAIINFDKSGFTERLLTFDDVRLIDSLVAVDNAQMISDSASSAGRVAEGAEGKHVFDLILKKFGHKWIDSIAALRYRSFGIQSMYNE